MKHKFRKNINKKSTRKKKSNIINDTIITPLDFCKLVEKYSYIIEELYEDDDTRNKVHYILSNMESLIKYDKSNMLTLFIKFLNFARLSSRIRLSKGQMLHILSASSCDSLILNDYMFVDFLITMYKFEEDEKSDENVIKEILYFFSNNILGTKLSFSKNIDNLLENINTNMNIYNISKYINSKYNLNKHYTRSIIKNLDIYLNTFLDSYIKMVDSGIIKDNKKINRSKTKVRSPKPSVICRSIIIDGKSFKSLTEACNHYNIDYSKIKNRLEHGWSIEDTFELKKNQII